MHVLSISCMQYVFIGIFHIFNMASKMAAKGHVTMFFIIDSNKSVIYKRHFCESLTVIG